MGTMDMTDFVDKGKLLRVAECSVEKVKQARFEQVPKDREQGDDTGHVSGAFGKRQNGRYLAASYGTMKIHINGMRIRNCLH
ncbi:hypothetical protein IFR10_11805 [Bacillus sp. CFBP 13597]|nr:hypothetical protein [Bacillus sp. CFBP 13597]